LRVNSHQPHERAEALFKKKQEQLREGQQAMAEYQAERHAVREKTARLRALRLARDAAIDQPEGSTGRTSVAPASPEKAKAPPKAKRPQRATTRSAAQAA
jgi:hypothetical protein